MDFQFSVEQQQLKKMVNDFAAEHIAPFAAQWDEEKICPLDTLRKAAALGLGGIYIKEDVGGCGLTRLDGTLIFEALAKACPSTAAFLSVQNMVAWLIDEYATEEQRHHWLPDLLTLNRFSSYCLTEPDAGSDAVALKTTAKREGDHYIINGTKAFISGGSISDVYLCMVRTGEAGSKGISAMLVEKGTPGLHFGKSEVKMGWNSQVTSMVFFEHCKVPVSNLIGQEGEGFKMALSALNGGRINIAACSLGGAQQCLELSRQYVCERKQFGKALQDFQSIQFKLADMLTDLEAAKLMTYRAACMLESKHPDAALYCAMAKRFATDHGFKICDDALQLYGGYGYLRDYPIERYFRDLRVHRILEGTNEIMRLITARRLFDPAFELGD